MIRPLCTLSLSLLYITGALFIYNMFSGLLSITDGAFCMGWLLALYAANMHVLMVVDQKMARGEIV